MGKDAGTAYDTGEVKEVYIIPRRGNVLEDSGLRSDMGRVPGKAEAVTVQGLLALVAVKALMDNGVYRLRNKGADGDISSKIKDKTADGLPPYVFRLNVRGRGGL